jgi:hypothetical protein
MPANLPEPMQVHKAIDIYLAHAYSAALPLPTRSMINLLKTWAGDFYAAPAFAKTGAPGAPRLTVRLGNSVYPHMKLAIEPAPDGESYVFKADSHDRHLCPAESDPDYGAFMELREKNQKIVEKIEQAWADAAIPTFKTYLQADLERRRSLPN